MMEKIVIEINGVRHRLVSDELPCDDFCSSVCSLCDYCKGSAFVCLCNVFAEHSHFEVE